MCDVGGRVGARGRWRIEMRVGGGGTKKGHLEMANVESEARVDLNRVVLVQGCLMEREKKLHFFL